MPRCPSEECDAARPNSRLGLPGHVLHGRLASNAVERRTEVGDIRRTLRSRLRLPGAHAWSVLVETGDAPARQARRGGASALAARQDTAARRRSLQALRPHAV